MSITRAAALTYLTGSYSDLAGEAGYDHTAATTTYDGVVDTTWRQLGTSESDLATASIGDARQKEVFALLDYYALTRYLRVFAIRTDVSIAGALTASRSQVFKQVQELLKLAEQTLEGLDLDPSDQFTMGRVTLDLFEADPFQGGEI